MPWECCSLKQVRLDMVLEMEAKGSNVAAICRKYKVSRKTAYKWLHRYRDGGADALSDRSRRPEHSPWQTAPQVRESILSYARAHDDWGPAKVRANLREQGGDLPCERTVHRIMEHADLTKPRKPNSHECNRFERAEPNDLWQLDFKGAISLGEGRARDAKGVPLGILDDHSRFLVCARALPDQCLETFWPAVWDTFGEYGLPDAILTDNENGLFASHRHGMTTWTARLCRLGIRHLRGRPYHPQTQGKIERYHGTLKRELLRHRHFASLEELQEGMDEFRQCYNHERPHEALNQKPPITRYRPSDRPRPDSLPQPEYAPNATLRKVTQAGYISLQGCRVHVGEGLTGEFVEVREEQTAVGLYYCGTRFRIVKSDTLADRGWV